MSAREFDVIVIGAGPAGEVCAGDLADAGLRVAIAERELVAGECAYWACIPSKTLLRPGEALGAARQVPGAREAIGAGLDGDAALEWRDFMVGDWDDTDKAEWLDEKGIELVRGTARVTGAGRVEVDGEKLEAPNIVVATGSEPAFPPVDGLSELDGIWTNREATAVKELPRSLGILGGGPVGVELGQAFARYGAEVTIIDGSEHLLSRENPAVGDAVGEGLRADGVEIRLGEEASGAELAGDQYELSFDGGPSLRVDNLLVATGRNPRLEGLGLDSAGAEVSESGVKVDSRLRAADSIWAIGDATGIWPFTHVGKYQARIVVANILGGDARADYRAVPRVVFCDPQAAGVGETDGPMLGTAQLSEIGRMSTYTREYDEHPGFLTLVSDGQRLTGAFGVGPESGEWLQQATLAIRAEVPLDVLRDTIQPFPTFSEAFVGALADLAQ